MLGGNAARNLAQKGIAAVTCPVTNNVGAHLSIATENFPLLSIENFSL